MPKSSGRYNEQHVVKTIKGIRGQLTKFIVDIYIYLTCFERITGHSK